MAQQLHGNCSSNNFVLNEFFFAEELWEAEMMLLKRRWGSATVVAIWRGTHCRGRWGGWWSAGCRGWCRGWWRGWPRAWTLTTPPPRRCPQMWGSWLLLRTESEEETWYEEIQIFRIIYSLLCGEAARSSQTILSAFNTSLIVFNVTWNMRSTRTWSEEVKMKVMASSLLYVLRTGSSTMAGILCLWPLLWWWPFFSSTLIMSVVSVSLRMSGLDLAILGHSWGVERTDPEGPHSHTAGGPIRIREIRLATTVLGLRMQRMMRTAGRMWRRLSLNVT